MSSNEKTVILVTGACGQIGTELTAALRARYGKQQVIAADLRGVTDALKADGPYLKLDVLDKYELEKAVTKNRVTQIYHLVAILSATGEKDPMAGWDLNMVTLLNVLEVARHQKVEKVFWPSSIAVFGPGAFKRNCPQESVTDPATVYGISKSAGEQWCAYYRDNYGMDIRSLRYPGLISHSAPPGGGTTDYAVDIFHKALQHQPYICFLKPDTALPMMYMADGVRATLELMAAPKQKLTARGAYNLAAMSFTPEQLAAEISAYLPDFAISYAPDQRQRIADSWPDSVSDAKAREDWDWQPQYEMVSMVADMLQHLQVKYPQQELIGS